MNVEVLLIVAILVALPSLGRALRAAIELLARFIATGIVLAILLVLVGLLSARGRLS